MVGDGGSSAGSYLADSTSPIPSHYAVIIQLKSVPVHQLLWLALKELNTSFMNSQDTFGHVFRLGASTSEYVLWPHILAARRLHAHFMPALPCWAHSHHSWSALRNSLCGLKCLSSMKCSVVIQRSWVLTPVRLNLWVCSCSVQGKT